MEEKSELVGEATDRKLAGLGHEVVEQREHLRLVVKEQIVERLFLAQCVSLVGHDLLTRLARCRRCAGLDAKVPRLVALGFGELLLLVLGESFFHQCVDSLGPVFEWRPELELDSSFCDVAPRRLVFFRFVRVVGVAKLNAVSARIEALIARAFATYQARERAKLKQDDSRYFYIQSGTKELTEDDKTKTVLAYKRYALGEDKTFENLFFDQKDQVLSLLDNFATKTGKFGIKGFPYKLGFLLHGPPGTGKTSLIKAIAHHTKRHIVTINLGKIKSNQELMDAIFDLTFAVDGLDSPVEYAFKDVIFVMEDIDCASSIVNKRTSDATDAADSKSDSIRLSPSVTNQVLSKISESASSDGNGDDDNDNATGSGLSSSTKPPSQEQKLMQMLLKMVMDDDRKASPLNLAGLLNVLDGVIDCPGRIIVMTSNHPEKLDPALIRPGRVNKKLLLSYMNATQVGQLIAYYTQTTLEASQVLRLEKVFAVDEKLVSPAEVEEMCAEFDSTDKIMDALEQVAFASRF